MKFSQACLVIVFSLVVSLVPVHAKTVTVGIYDNKPMVFMDNSGPNGLFIDVLRHIAVREGWTLRFRYGKWDYVFDLVKKGQVDVLPGVALKASRKAYLDYNQDPILSNWGVVYTRKNLKVGSILDLSGKRIAVQPDDTHGEYFSDLLRKLGVGCTRVDIANYTDIFKALDAQACDAGVVNFINSKMNARFFDVQITPIVFNPVGIHYAVPKGDPAGLLEGVNRRVTGLKADPKSIYHKSMATWFGVVSEKGDRFPLWLKWSFGILAAVFILLFTGNMALRRHVKNKTRELVLELNKRKQAEEELRFQALLLDNIHDHVTATDLDGNIVYVNDAEVRILKRGRDRLMGQPVSVYGDNPEKGATQAEILAQTLEQGAWRGEVVNYASDGEEIIMDCRTRLIRDENGSPWRMVGISTDITQRKRSEAEKELLLTAIEQSPETVIITDADGRIQYANSAATLLTGYDRETLVGSNPRIVKSGEHDQEFYAQMWATITGGDTWKGTIVNRRKDGTLYTEEASISPVQDESGKISNFVAVKRDISDELRLKNQLTQARKMETIGTLAGGIAHDFNNILFPILGHTEILLGDERTEERAVRDSLNQIYASALRAKSLVQQILTFSRQENTEYRPLKIQLILKEVIRLLRSTIPKNIEVKQFIDTGCRPVNADATQIHQVIMNLTTNACHAMGGDGGELGIRLEDARISGSGTQRILPGIYVRLTVSDTGVGMTHDLIEKAFDPFFTTKEKGKGTGMGLSVVHGIVENMKGSITVDSTPGRGTAFKVYFPVDDATAGSDTPPPAHEPLHPGTETLLLVDDEQAVLDMVRLALEKLGYEVCARVSPVDALETFKQRPREFDLVITDLSMPQMTGEQLVSEMLKIRKDTPVIVCTGFSETLTPDTATKLGIRDVAMKPVILRELSGKIRSVLDALPV